MHINQSMDVTVNTHTFARKALANHDTAHNYHHALLVLQNAIKIMVGLESMNVANIDEQVVMYSSLFHDIIDHKMYPGIDQDKLFESIIQPFFVEENLTHLSSRVKYIICNMSWSKQKEPNSIEMSIVMDADRLEAIGCIGIARTFAYSASSHASNHVSNPLTAVVDHYHEKLQYIGDNMFTTVGKQLASERRMQMTTFFMEFMKQIQVTTPNSQPI